MLTQEEKTINNRFGNNNKQHNKSKNKEINLNWEINKKLEVDLFISKLNEVVKSNMESENKIEMK